MEETIKKSNMTIQLNDSNTLEKSQITIKTTITHYVWTLASLCEFFEKLDELNELINKHEKKEDE